MVERQRGRFNGVWVVFYRPGRYHKTRSDARSGGRSHDILIRSVSCAF